MGHTWKRMPNLRSLGRHRRAAASALVVLLTSTSQAQAPLSTRLLRAEDARILSVEAHAVMAEGMKSADPKVRAQAVRAAGRSEVMAPVCPPGIARVEPDSGFAS